MSLSASALAATFAPPSETFVRRLTPRRSASCDSTPATSSTTTRASQLPIALPPRTAGRLNCSNRFSFVESHPISSSTIFVSPRTDSGSSGFSICTCRMVFIDPSGFFRLCEMLAAIWPTSASRSRSANSLSSRSFSSISRHKSSAPGSCSHKNSSAARVSPENPAPCGSACSTPTSCPPRRRGKWSSGDNLTDPRLSSSKKGRSTALLWSRKRSCADASSNSSFVRRSMVRRRLSRKQRLQPGTDTANKTEVKQCQKSRRYRIKKILLAADLQEVVPPYEVDKRRERQGRQQRKDCSESLCRPRIHSKRGQVQTIDGQERHCEKQQQCPMKVTLWFVWSGRRKAPFPTSAPRQRNRQHNREAFPQRTSWRKKIEMRVLEEGRNPVDGEMQSGGIKKEQHATLPRLH